MVRKCLLAGLTIVATVVATLVVGALIWETEPAAEASEAQPEETRLLAQGFEEESFEDRIARVREEEGELLAGRTGNVTAVDLEARKQQDREEPETKRVRRWVWESPAETRSKLWNVPLTESRKAAATGLLRICMAEADGRENDCIGIWQVLNNIRSSGCDRQRIRRITECDGSGETLLSVMRRAQRFALGVAPPRSRRTRWIAELELTCEQPESYPGGTRQWRGQYSRSCASTAALAKRLVSGEHIRPVIRGARPIAWGGRCEDERGACDDPLACARGLARIPNTQTANAFWCRRGSRRCPAAIDPVCLELGFTDQPQAAAKRRPREAPSG